MGTRVSVTVEAHVADVRLTRPDKHNALDLEMFLALRDAVAQVRDEPSVRAVVLSGEGPSFCSGLDLAGAASGDFDPAVLLDRPDGEVANLAQTVGHGWRQLPIPVIAAVHGVCFGGGLQIALGADVRIAAPDARLSIMEIKLGLIPDMSITQGLPRLVGADIAKELAMTGRIFDGTEAAALGVVTRTAEDPQAVARALAREIAGKSPEAIRSTKRLFDEAWGLDAAASLKLETELVRPLFGTPNQLEAVRAAVMRDEPTFADPVADVSA